jgi:hypothetical protein
VTVGPAKSGAVNSRPMRAIIVRQRACAFMFLPPLRRVIGVSPAS